MPLPALEAHVVCAALVAADIIARALRLRAILRGLGQEVPFARLVALTLTGDAACALTPYRAGGDPARVGVLTRAGVPWKRAVAALVAEATVMWPVTLAVGGLLAAWGGATWWRAVASGAAKIGPVVWPPSATLVFVLAISMAAGAVALRRLRRRLPGWTRAEGRGRLPISPRLLLATAALTLVTVSARVLVLPVLLSAGSETTSLGAALAGSFALLYCQLLLPLPAGAGAVDVGLLAAAEQRPGAVAVLLLWRLYTSGLGLLLGLAALPLVLRRRAPRPTAAAAGPASGGPALAKALLSERPVRV